LTLEIWAKPTAVNGYDDFFDLGTDRIDNRIVLGRSGRSNDLALWINGDSAIPIGSLVATGAIELNKWQQFVVTMDGNGQITLYKSGQAIATGHSDPPNDIVRTRNLLGSNDFQGQLDEAAIYDYALTADQVRKHYQAGTTANTPGTAHVVVTVNEGGGRRASQSFDLPVLATAPNELPKITSTPPTLAGLGNEFVYQLTANDPDGDPLTYSLAQAPAGMTIDTNGQITWQPTGAEFGANAVRV